jgi:hypothetical protein
MKKVKVIQWLISHHHATRMMKKLNTKQHRAFGFYYEFEDVGLLWQYVKPPAGARQKVYESRCTDKEKLRIYGDYPGGTEGGLLTIYRDIPEAHDKPEVLTHLQRTSLPDWMMTEARDARRELGKWLNEQPNREVDKSAIATLIAVFDTLAG